MALLKIGRIQRRERNINSFAGLLHEKTVFIEGGSCRVERTWKYGMLIISSLLIGRVPSGYAPHRLPLSNALSKVPTFFQSQLGR